MPPETRRPEREVQALGLGYWTEDWREAGVGLNGPLQ